MSFKINIFTAGVIEIFIVSSIVLEEEFFLLRFFNMVFARFFLIEDFFGLGFLRENIAIMI